LTGLNNRAGFEMLAQQKIRIAKRYHHHIGLIFIDLDDMKHWNDDYGHAAGDAALKAVGAAITASIREVDICGRIGGDEFAILGYVRNRGDLTTIITRIRNVLQTTRISVPGSKKPIHETPKISAGASVFFEPVKESLEEMMDMADREMYRDKNRKK
jgi:diguanylate cyclase (GGDEF)-like protein